MQVVLDALFAACGHALDALPSRMPRVYKLNFSLPLASSHRPLCNWCFAAAMGMISYSTEGKQDRFKTSWDLAVSTYYARETSYVCLTERGATSSEKIKWQPQSRGLLAEAWIMRYISPEAGNAEYRTTDMAYHLGFTSVRDLHGQYTIDCLDRFEDPLSYSAFWFVLSKINNDTDNNIKIKLGNRYKTQQACAECSDCKHNIAQFTRKKQLPQVHYWKARLETHVKNARAERVRYELRKMHGRSSPGVWSIGMDGFCSFKTRCFMHLGHQMKDRKGSGLPGDAKTFAWKTTGVLVHGIGLFLYVLQPFLQANGNANIQLTYTPCI